MRRTNGQNENYAEFLIIHGQSHVLFRFHSRCIAAESNYLKSIKAITDYSIRSKAIEFLRQCARECVSLSSAVRAALLRSLSRFIGISGARGEC